MQIETVGSPSIGNAKITTSSTFSRPVKTLGDRYYSRTSSDGIGLTSIWIGGGAPAGSRSRSPDLDAGVAWIEAHRAPGALQLIPYQEGVWALYSQYTANS